MNENVTSLMSHIVSSRKGIIYYPELNKITGSIKATLLLQKCLYWYTLYGNEFYKFKSPCNHEKYNKGESWCEELGFTIKQFDSAFKKIGTKLTKSNINTPHNKLIECHTDLNRITYYKINTKNLSITLESL